VIGAQMSMTEKARLDMYSSWGAWRSPGFQRNNPL